MNKEKLNPPEVESNVATGTVPAQLHAVGRPPPPERLPTVGRLPTVAEAAAWPHEWYDNDAFIVQNTGDGECVCYGCLTDEEKKAADDDGDGDVDHLDGAAVCADGVDATCTRCDSRL